MWLTFISDGPLWHPDTLPSVCGQDGVDMVAGCKVRFREVAKELGSVDVYYAYESPKEVRITPWTSADLKSFTDNFKCGSVYGSDPDVTRLCRDCAVRAGFIW